MLKDQTLKKTVKRLKSPAACQAVVIDNEVRWKVVSQIRPNRSRQLVVTLAAKGL